MQFIFCKHLQIIVSRLGCSPSKRLTRNWTVVAIVFFLWRAPLGLSSLRLSSLIALSRQLTQLDLSLCTFTLLPQSAFHVFAVLGFSSRSLLCLARGVSEGADVAAVHIFQAAACSSVLSHKHMNPWHDLEHARCTTFSLISWSPMSQHQYLLTDSCLEHRPSEQREYNLTNLFMSN